MSALALVQISTGVAVLALSLLVAVLLFIGQEGLYLLGRRLRPSGIDVLVYNRLSRSLRLTTIRWNGSLWDDGKSAKYFGLDVLKDPKEAAKQQYNRALQEAAQWAGCRRPVLLAGDRLCFVYNVGFADLLARTDTPANIRLVLDWLQEHWDKGYTEVDVMQPIPHDELSKFLSASTPDELSDTYDTAYGDGVRDATKPKKGLQISPLKLAIGAGAILALIVVIVLVQRGAIKLPSLPGVKLWWSLLCARS